MNRLAIIGGSGLDQLEGLLPDRRESVMTPYGEPSAALSHGRFGSHEVIFLARHGDHHQWPPHRINYRANIWALRQAGAKAIVAVAAVGGISPAMVPQRMVIPDQLIDYTWGRDSTFFDGPPTPVEHIDFTVPYSEPLRQRLLQAATRAGIKVLPHGVLGVTQGPRLESAAEIRRMARDGCDLVGMTALPEAALARELGLDYTTCAVIVNRAAGLGDGPITLAEIESHLAAGMMQVKRLLAAILD